MKVGFLGFGVMGSPMSINVVKKCGCQVLGYDVVASHLKIL
jgi:3-hydroxyisobutyrate dehydrogenase-like beta-hydroxyacid dehydrogenase